MSLRARYERGNLVAILLHYVSTQCALQLHSNIRHCDEVRRRNLLVMLTRYCTGANTWRRVWFVPRDEASGGFFLYHLEPISIRVLIIYFNRIIPINSRPALNTGNNGRFIANHYLILHGTDKLAADDAFMYKFITFF